MIIFLDLDGVIINWVKGVFDWFNMPYEPEKVTSWDCMPGLIGVNKKDFYNLIKTPKFWENLEFYPEAKSFIEQLQKYGTVILLTSPAHGCAGYRQNWIQKNLPEFFNNGHYILSPAKWACARKDTILIDDSDKNCTEFFNHDGHVITYPQPWNCKRDTHKKYSEESTKNAFILTKISLKIMFKNYA